MDAMVLAAGLGTRLGTRTQDRPKALVEVAGRALLERVARRLVTAGVDRLVVNLHPFPEQVRAFVRERENFDVDVLYSLEAAAPLETGGALRHARALFRRDAPFLIHNVDVLSDLPLEALYRAQVDSHALATLAVMERPTTRRLLFDERGLLGRVDQVRGVDLRVREPTGEVQALAFAGVHAASPALLDRITEEGAFSILQPYLRLAAEGAVIQPLRVDGSRWHDVGKQETFAEAEALAKRMDAGT